MNLLTLLATANSTILLLVSGVALLIITIVYGLFRTWRGHVNAGRVTVVLALVACALVLFGAVQVASANYDLGVASARFASAAGAGAGGNRFGGRAAQGAQGAGQNAPVAGNANATPVGTTSASADGALQPISDTQANTGNAGNTANTASNNAQAPAVGTPAADESGGTQQAAGTPTRRFSGTRGAPGTASAGGSGTGTGGNRTGNGTGGGSATGGNAANGQTGQNGQSGQGGQGGANAANGGNPASNFAGNPNAAANAALVQTVQLDQSALPTVVLGGVLATLLALALYFYERRRDDFSVAKSRGLMLAAAGFFVIVATLLVPIIPGQITGAVAAAGVTTARTNARPVAFAQPATASPVPTATVTATDLPSLTPAMTATPLPMPTQIAYVSTYTSGLQNSVCTAVANAYLSLRSDPSTSLQAIGRLLGGSLLNVTGMSADKKWLHVIATADNGIDLEGWVSVDFATLNSSCNSQGVPIVDAIGNIIQTSAPPATSGATGAASSPASDAVTTAPCTLLTTAAASLRPDPSLAHAPLTSIPAQTALLASGKSANGQWWQVSYGSATGWLGAGAVFASSGCTAVQTVS